MECLQQWLLYFDNNICYLFLILRRLYLLSYSAPALKTEQNPVLHLVNIGGDLSFFKYLNTLRIIKI